MNYQQITCNTQDNAEEIPRLNEEDIPSIKSNEIFDYLLTSQEESRIITVKYTTVDFEVFTQSYEESTSIEEVKTILSNVFNINSELIMLLYEGELLHDEMMLGDFDAGEHRILNFLLKSSDENYLITAKYAYKDYTIPDIITVTVTYEDGGTKEIVVEIEDKAIIKPFLGGYINKITQIEYRHGYTQTGPLVKKIEKSHRETQTLRVRNRKLETVYSQGTQMQNDLYNIPNITDKILNARKYETAKKRAARLDIENKVRTIQRYYRAWRIRQALKVLCAEYRKRIELEIEDDEFLLKDDEERKHRELIGKIFPHTKADFYMLYTMLENWKKAEIERIKLLTCGPSKIAEMYLLLEKEIEILLSIERQKERVKRDRKIKKELEFLETISNPISWNSDYKNLPIEMDTLETQAGKKYHQMYTEVCDSSKSYEEKLQAYIDVKSSLTNHNNCEVGSEIKELIDRMCTLISRKIADCHLEVLQKRIEACMLKHLTQPECCEGIAMRVAKIKEKMMIDNLFYCIRCSSYKHYQEFTGNDVKTCINCAWNDRVMEPWMDIQPYHYLLKCIRREERRKSSHSSIAFILTEKDIHHMVTQIWQSHSAINECPDIYKLRLCRFFKDQDWAPWNCILLTYEESKAHQKITDLKEVYDPEFLNMVRYKHTMSRRYFTTAMNLENYFQEIGIVESRWDEIVNKKEFIAVNTVHGKVNVFRKCH